MTHEKDIIADCALPDCDYNELIETSLMLIEDLIHDDPFIFAQPNFHDYLFYHTSILIQQCIDDYDLHEIVEIAIEDAIQLSDIIVAPLRSYPYSFIISAPNIEKMSEQITYLENIPQPEQRTNEWYLFRHKYLTASSIWKAFGSQKMQMN